MTHPEALVEKIAAEIDPAAYDLELPIHARERRQKRARARAARVLDLFEVREEHGIDPNMDDVARMGIGSIRAALAGTTAEVPDFAKDTHHRYVLTTEWQEDAS